jgi:hypothetical protein
MTSMFLCLVLIIEFPNGVTDLIKVWLENRFYYITLDGENSILFDLVLGTVHG